MFWPISRVRRAAWWTLPDPAQSLPCCTASPPADRTPPQLSGNCQENGHCADHNCFLEHKTPAENRKTKEKLLKWNNIIFQNYCPGNNWNLSGQKILYVLFLKANIRKVYIVTISPLFVFPFQFLAGQFSASSNLENCFLRQQVLSSSYTVK